MLKSNMSDVDVDDSKSEILDVVDEGEEEVSEPDDSNDDIESGFKF